MAFEVKSLPLSSIRTDLFDGSEPWESTLSLSIAQLRERPWNGVVISEKNGVVLAATRPSEAHPGFVDYRCVASSGMAMGSKNPLHAVGVGLALDQMLSEFELKCNDLKWSEGDLPPNGMRAAQVPNAGVYFVQATIGGLVKIGVSKDARKRLETFQCGSPVELRIVKLIENVARSHEAKLHAHFARFRVRGEWFDPIVLEMGLPE